MAAVPEGMRGNWTAMAVTIAAVILLSGCSGTVIGGPSISNPEAQLSEQVGPYLIFNYSVDDYSTVLLENPNGRVISDGTLEPEQNFDALPMGEPQAGTYTIIIQQGGETAVMEEITFDGPDPVVTSVEPQWSNNHLTDVTVQIRNRGDLPVQVTSATYEVRGESVSDFGVFQWVPAGGSESISVRGSISGQIVVTEPGIVTTDVRVNTSDGVLDGASQREFQHPRLEVAEMSPTWESGGLRRIDFSVQNVGELPASFTATSFVNGERLLQGEATLQPGESEVYNHRSGAPFADPLYQVTSAGEYEVSILVESQFGANEESATQQFQGVQTSLSEISTTAFSNFGTDTMDVYSISLNVRNEGDIPLGVDSVRFSVAGENRLQQLFIPVAIHPGQTETIDVVLSDHFTVESGSHEMTISFIDDGEVMDEQTVRVMIS